MLKKPKPKSKKMCCYGRPRLYFTYVTLNVISLKDIDLTSCIAWGSYSNATTSAFASTCRLVVVVVVVVVVNGWLGSRVVSVLDSGAERARVQIAVATLSGNGLGQTVHTHCASVHQAATLVAALVRVAGVTAGLAESNGSLPPGL